ncbi:unnamed protein product [Allacma fusca]|uniref:K Homology domain-containing protein n=1 Tax=Allacma fusca TaxID=39272 RepID=A0A8J2Q531_9HEXA|nr:unnamed protein product [Allacma fusca]
MLDWELVISSNFKSDIFCDSAISIDREKTEGSGLDWDIPVIILEIKMSDIESNGRTDRKPNVGGGGGYDGPVDEKFAEYVSSLMNEKDSLDPERYPIIHRLITQELSTISKGAVGAGQESGYIDLYSDTPITLYVKAMPPSKVFPKFNYAGRIIGPKGAYLKALMKETMTKMILLGKGVMKDKDKEDQLRRGNDPKYYHLHEDMHVAIQVTAPAAEAYARVAYALKCLKQQVLSDNRSLEDLPWISNASKYLEGGGGGGEGPTTREFRSIRTYSPPPPRQARATHHIPRRTSHEYPDDSAQYSHSYEYPREPISPGHSSKQPYYANPAYDASRRPTSQPESSRAMDYVDKIRHNMRPHSNHGGRAVSPAARPIYDYAHNNAAMYDPEPAHHYYDDGRSVSTVCSVYQEVLSISIEEKSFLRRPCVEKTGYPKIVLLKSASPKSSF